MQTAPRMVKRLSADAGLWACVHDAAGRRVIAAGTDGRIHLVDEALGQVTGFLTGGHRSYVTALALANGTRQLLSGGYDRRLAGWDPERTEGPAWTRELAAPVKGLAASGGVFAAVLDNLTAFLGEVGTGRTVRALENGHPERTVLTRANTLYSVAFSPDGEQVATGDRLGVICLWSAKSGALVRRVEARSLYTQGFYDNPLGKNISSEYDWGGVRALAFSPDGSRLYASGMGPADHNSAGIDGLMKLIVLDVATGRELHGFLLDKRKGILDALVPAAGRVFGAGGGGGAGDGGVGTLTTWDPVARDTQGKPAPPVVYESPVVLRDLAVDSAGRRVWTVGMEKSVTAGRVELWEFAAAP